MCSNIKTEAYAAVDVKEPFKQEHGKNAVQVYLCNSNLIEGVGGEQLPNAGPACSSGLQLDEN